MFDCVKKNGKKDGMCNKIIMRGDVGGRVEFSNCQKEGKNIFCLNFPSKLFTKQYFFGF
jgi:hypothetical protein